MGKFPPGDDALECLLRAYYHGLHSETRDKAARRRSWRRLQVPRRGTVPQPATHRSVQPRPLSAPLAAAAFLILAAASGVLAASVVINLGKPTTSVPSNANFPLSGFHRAPRSFPALRSHGLPELLWIGTAWPGDAASDVERWPVVKALQQFGTFTGIVGAKPGCGKPRPAQGGPVSDCSLPTLDWSASRYMSRYVAFLHRDLIDAEGKLYQRLSPTQATVFNRYIRAGAGNSALDIGQSIAGTFGAARPGHQFPLIAVGGYLETASQIPIGGDMAGSVAIQPGSLSSLHAAIPARYYSQPLTYLQAQHALASGKAPSGYPQLVSDMNAEANVITALICHADGAKPRGVCSRSPIKQLLRRVK